MRKIIIGIIFCTFLTSLKSEAQEVKKDSSSAYITMNEVVVSATKFKEKINNVAQKIDVITQQYIAKVNAQNTGDLLASTGNIYVQKSQQGGSSPVIRGFEASRVLLVIDGVRMNNLIYRSGHLQNVITVNQSMLQNVEVMYGPSSTLYGSDALGGIINFTTKMPKLADSNKYIIGGNAFVRYSTVNNERTAHANINIGLKKLAWLQAYSFSNFGDMKMGANYSDKYPNFGKRDSFIATINGVDTVLKNANSNLQKFSGYKQWDILQKLFIKQNKKITHLFNMQFSNTSNVPRYDRLQDKRNGTLRFAEWYYGPQKRNFYAYELNVVNINGLFDEVKFNLSHQNIEESRQTREFKKYDRFDSQVEKVKVEGFVIDARKKIAKHELTMGVDGQLNMLTSSALRTNIKTGATSKIATRFPDGKNNMNNLGIYAQHTYKIINDKLILNDGIRWQTTKLTSTLIDTALLFHLPYTKIQQTNTAITGNVGIIYLLKNTKLSLVFSSGFRSPNVDDLAKIFESSTAAKQLVVPNPAIEPESTYNIDFGLNHAFNNKIKFALHGFYTWFKNAIIKAPYLLNGQDSINYYGVKSQVLASQNRNKAYIVGINANVYGTFGKHFTASGSLNYTKGRFQTNAKEKSAVYEKQANGTYTSVQKFVSSKPLDHIPPIFGKVNLQYINKSLLVELFSIYNGWKKLDQYNADGEDNAQYATNDGTPSWVTFNIRGSYDIDKNIVIQLAVENITDKNYRYFASGFSAPGRNFIVALRFNL